MALAARRDRQALGSSCAATSDLARWIENDTLAGLVTRVRAALRDRGGPLQSS
jgi:hypothetical protein